MYGFFFASLVALTLSGSTTTNTTLVSCALVQNYNADGYLESYFYDAENEDEPIARTTYGNVEYNTRYFSINVPNFEPIKFRTEVEYGALSGGLTDSYVGIESFVVDNSISTNIYLDNFRFEILSDSNQYVYTPDWKMEFKGQSTKYWDNYDGQYQIDLPFAYNLTNYYVYMSFYIKCTDHTLLEGQWYNNGYNDGKAAGLSEGETTGYNNGYSVGYQAGYEQGYSTDSTVTSIFSGILQVALVPINFFLAIFNFEILGINLSGFVRALFTIAITVIIIRTIFGGKGASDS